VGGGEGGGVGGAPQRRDGWAPSEMGATAQLGCCVAYKCSNAAMLCSLPQMLYSAYSIPPHFLTHV